MKQLGVVKRNNWFQWSRVEKYGFHSCCVPQNPQPKKFTFIIFYLFFMSRTALIEHLTQHQKAESSLWSYLLEVFNWDFATMSLTICYNPVRFGKLSPQFDVIWFRYTVIRLTAFAFFAGLLTYMTYFAITLWESQDKSCGQILLSVGSQKFDKSFICSCSLFLE